MPGSGKDALDRAVGKILSSSTRLVLAAPRAVVLATAVLTVVFGLFAARTLRLDMDHTKLVDENLPFRKTYREFAAAFPILDNALLVVVDAPSGVRARQAASELADELRKHPDLFSDVFVPGAGPFFERNALLYLDVEELEEFADRLAMVQPIVAELLRDPSVANLARLVELGLEEIRHDQRDPSEWARLLDRLSSAVVSVYDEFPVSFSWEDLLLEGSAIDPRTRQVVVVEPVLDFESLLPAARPLAAIRAAARKLRLAEKHSANVRITGNPALNHEEMLGLARDVGLAGLFSAAFVAVLLYAALRSVRVVLAVLLVLGAGLVWTGAFAAWAVGYLNVLSVCFAVLFVGLAVDFGIHFSLRYLDLRQSEKTHEEASFGASREVGSSLVLCALTTALGFWAFLPTPYRGVAQLGLISGVGVLVGLLLTLSLLPALLASYLHVPRDGLPAVSLRFSFPNLARTPRPVLLGTLLFALAALVLAPRVRFDSDILAMRDPDTESARAFADLLADADHSPWYVDVVAPSLEEAERLAERLRRLPGVGRVVTARSYVPQNQEEKRAILADVAVLLDFPEPEEGTDSSLPPEEQIRALRELRDFLSARWLEERDTELARSVKLLRQELGRFLERIEKGQEPQRVLAALEKTLLGPLPDLVRRLRRALDPEEVRLENLPPEIRSRMLAPDGRARLQVFPRTPIHDTESLGGFAREVAAIAPNVTGMGVNIYEFGRATVRSLRQALLTAAVAITLLLWLLFRRLSDVLLVLAPLALAMAGTCAAMVLLGWKFNFANVVVLPLLLGVGVDSGIHLVHRSRLGLDSAGALLRSSTARGVFYSALTTLASFGSLALSHHRGVESLGKVLTLGMALTLLANLVVLPALLDARRRRG
ncbi:MAG: hypothetical protein KatS3mg076_1496 [Candidatus Binatia bacterium]|nr:MAG: hypothetical protein KatS3mg076_1496 [Candidatus Binatia bacterium]